jgi:hypothetical protein
VDWKHELPLRVTGICTTDYPDTGSIANSDRNSNSRLYRQGLLAIVTVTFWKGVTSKLRFYWAFFTKWRPCPSINLSVFNLVSASKPFVGFSCNSVPAQDLFTTPSAERLNFVKIGALTATLYWRAFMKLCPVSSVFLRDGYNSAQTSTATTVAVYFMKHHLSSTRTLLTGVNKLLFVLSTFTVQFWWNSVIEICTQCRSAFASIVKIGAGCAVLFISQLITLHFSVQGGRLGMACAYVTEHTKVAEYRLSVCTCTNTWTTLLTHTHTHFCPLVHRHLISIFPHTVQFKYTHTGKSEPNKRSEILITGDKTTEYVEIKCQLDATDVFYCRSYCLLNMFRAPLCPSSGAQEYYTVAVYRIWCLVLKLSV